MIILTGAAGFIGSCILTQLNQKGIRDIIIVDDFSRVEKEANFTGKDYTNKVERDTLFGFLKGKENEIEYILHIGARTDTTEFDVNVFNKLNLNYTKTIWEFCAENTIPLIYASSAATYGMGELGYKDEHDIVEKLQPLNPYGESKNNFDKWALKQKSKPPFWYGLKFFNVYGPNEYHKGRMASVIMHAYNQIISSGKVKLFRSHNPDYEDGKQLRDFIYVKDVVEIIQFLMQEKPGSGLYNLGTGKARSFLDLAKGTFAAMGKEAVIEFIDTPIDIRDKYQYFTEADMAKLRETGYKKEFTSLEEGITDYVREYLLKKNYF
jgi:ADP-L-glycero-D-manno-heptose 6-epimerase